MLSQTEIMMGMPIIVGSPDATGPEQFTAIFDYFRTIDACFSPYKPDSELSRLNRGELALAQTSSGMQLMFQLAEQTKQETGGYFDIGTIGQADPSGLVKGWAIEQASLLARRGGWQNLYINAGGDVATIGLNQGQPWRVGIADPQRPGHLLATIRVTNAGVATSGRSERGAHIIDPITQQPSTWLLSLTVVAPNIYQADRLATAAFAMGRFGLAYLEALPGIEALQVDRNGRFSWTSGFPELSHISTGRKV